MHRFLSIRDWTKIQTGQKSLDQKSYLGNSLTYGHQIWYGEGQGSRSKVKVTMPKMLFTVIDYVTGIMQMSW